MFCLSCDYWRDDELVPFTVSDDIRKQVCGFIPVDGVWVGGAVLFDLGAFSSLAFPFTPEFFHLSRTWSLPVSFYLSSLCLVTYRAVTEVLHFPWSAAIVPVSSHKLHPVHSFSADLTAILQSLLRSCHSLFDDWIIELIMSLTLVCDNHGGLPRKLSWVCLYTLEDFQSITCNFVKVKKSRIIFSKRVIWTKLKGFKGQPLKNFVLWLKVNVFCFLAGRHLSRHVEISMRWNRRLFEGEP